MNHKNLHENTMKNKRKTWKYEIRELHLNNPVALIAQGKEALDMYYDTIGQKFNADSREIVHSQPRMAFGMALTKHLNENLAAEILGKDRTTVLHYRRNHRGNLEAWCGYDTYFETAQYVVDTYFDGMAKVNRIKYIDKIVNRLIKEKLNIQSQFNEQLQVQDH